MVALNDAKTPYMTFEEVLADGSTITNPDADHRAFFLGEDGLCHLKDSAGSVTDVGGGGGITQITGTGDGHITFGATRLEMYSPNGWVGGTEWSEFYLAEGIIELMGVHTPAAFASKGVVMTVGDDGRYVYFSERSSSRVEVHGASGASYSIELVDDPASTGAVSMGRFLHVDDGGNASIPSLGVARKFGSAPTAQFAGELYYDTGTNKLRCWNGSTWNDLF